MRGVWVVDISYMTCGEKKTKDISGGLPAVYFKQAPFARSFNFALGTGLFTGALADCGPGYLCVIRWSPVLSPFLG